MTLGAGALAAPIAAFAQQRGRVWRVGFLTGSHIDFVDTDFYYGPFRQSMRELGYVDGKNLVIEWRSAEGKPERLAMLATELVKLKVDLIVVGGLPAAQAAQKATADIPIILSGVGDPVGTGLIKSLARPGGNITGLSNMGAELNPKRLELLVNMVPKVSRVAVLGNTDTVALGVKNIQSAAQRTSVSILPTNAGTPSELKHVFAAMAQDRAGAVIVLLDPFLSRQVRLIAELAVKHQLPAIGGLREFAEAGGLMSYGSNVKDQYRRTASYVDKILRGAKPADLPVEQPTIFELVINGRTAKALGLTIPYALRISATQVIE
jgi:putative ABC transport system substrate-binding protein